MQFEVRTINYDNNCYVCGSEITFPPEAVATERPGGSMRPEEETFPICSVECVRKVSVTARDN